MSPAEPSPVSIAVKRPACGPPMRRRGRCTALLILLDEALEELASRIGVRADAGLSSGWVVECLTC